MIPVLVSAVDYRAVAAPALDEIMWHDIVISDGARQVGGVEISADSFSFWSESFDHRTTELSSTPLGGSLLVSPGPNGCAGPVHLHLYVVDPARPHHQVFLSSAIYPGTGTMSLDYSNVSALNPDRGFDYYLTVAGGLITGEHPILFMHELQNFPFLAGLRPRWGGVAPIIGQAGRFWVEEGAATTFGVNRADLPSLQQLTFSFVGVRDGPAVPSSFPTTARVHAYLSRGLGGAAVVLGFADREVAIGDVSIALQLDWSKADNMFPAPPIFGQPAGGVRNNNTLRKRTNTIFVPGSPGSPGSPGTPAVPGRNVSFVATACSWRPAATTLSALNPMFPTPAPALNTGVQVLSPPQWECANVHRTVWVPGQPAVPATAAVAPVPAQTLHDFNLGWTGRARSIRVFPQNGRATFRASQVTGAVIGLSTSFRQTGFADIAYAFRLEHGVARIVEGGTVVASLGTYTQAQTFEIRRFGGRISYLIDGAVVRDVPNTSAPMHLDAVMFTGGDNIFDPSIQGLTSSATSLLPLASSGGGMQFTPATPAVGTAAASLQPLSSVGWATRRAGASGFARLSPLRVLSRAGVRAHTRLQPLGGMGSNRPYAGAATQLMRLTGQAEGGLGTPAYSVASGALAPLIGTAVMQTGGLLSSASTLRRLYGLASDRVYSAAQTHLRPVVGYGVIKSASEMRELSLVELAVSQSLIEMFGDLVIVMTSTGRISGAISYTAAVSAQVSSTATATTEYVLAALLSANIISAVSARSIEAFGAEGGTVWVVNAETDAGTQYENFGFNSFAKIGGTYYGAKEGGVYALDGDTDDGEAIQSMIALGKKNFGTTTRSHLMRLENCYMGVASDGRLVLKVRAEGKEHIYRTRASSRELQTQRVDIGRGLRANFMEFEIWNQNGGDFSLQSVEFAAVVLNRRI